MRLDLSLSAPSIITVTLSERNCRALLSKLTMPDSQRTIFSGNVYRDGLPVNGYTFFVEIEPDDVHYNDREPGPMHPHTERDLKEGDQNA